MRFLLRDIPHKIGCYQGYYHFLLEFIFQVYSYLKKEGQINSGTVLVDERISRQLQNFKGVLPEVFPGIEFIFNSDKTAKYDKIFVLDNLYYTNQKIQGLNKISNEIITNLNIPSSEKKYAILIEREKTPNLTRGYYRRYIENHSHLNLSLQEYFENTCIEFLNLRLVELPFKDQVYFFKHARLIIGQHGAGLTNMLWSNKGCSVIEIKKEGHRRGHFKNLAKALELKYLPVDSIQVRNSTGTVVDVSKIIDLINRNKIEVKDAV